MLSGASGASSRKPSSGSMRAISAPIRRTATRSSRSWKAACLPMPAAPGDSVSAQIFEVASKVESARAKINLALHVTGRRADGYHLLDSLVVFADVADTLKAVRQEESLVKLSLDGQFASELADAGPTRDNLVIRAADELMASFPGR